MLVRTSNVCESIHIRSCFKLSSRGATRDDNRGKRNYDTTKRWHFVDLEITPDMKAAGYGRKPLRPVRRRRTAIRDKMARIANKSAAVFGLARGARSRCGKVSLCTEIPAASRHWPRWRSSCWTDHSGSGARLTIDVWAIKAFNIAYDDVTGTRNAPPRAA
jgi:hypothetical protein